MTRLSAIHRLLGVAPGSANPFELLGLPRDEDVSEEQVQQALDRQLQRLSRHPLGAGHEADEVRLALHAAAAQLLDPNVRSHLVRHTRLSDLWTSESAPSQTARLRPAPAGNGADNAMFRRDATRVLAIGRGLNDSTRKTLIGLARVHGLGGDELVRELRSLSGSSLPKRPRPAPRPEGAAPPAQPAPKQTIYEQIQSEADIESERMRRIVRRVWSGLAIALVAAPGAIVLAALLWSGTPGGAPVAETPGDARETTEAPSIEPRSGQAQLGLQADSSEDEGERSSTRPDRLEADELLKELRIAVEMYVRAPGDAAWRFEDAAEKLAAWWPTYEEPVLIAMNAQAVEMAHLVTAGSASADRTLAALAGGAQALGQSDALIRGDQVWPALWSVGILTRLAADRELAAPKLRRAEAELSAALSVGRLSDQETFRSGVLAAIETLADRLPLSDGTDVNAALTWERWIGALDRVTTGAPDAGPPDREVRERILLGACERILEGGPSPAINPTARTVLLTLLEDAEWGEFEGDEAPTPARLRVLRWFNDPAIRSADLAVVTEWLQSQGRLGGAGDVTLSRKASPQRRAASRERLAEAWGLTHLTADGGLAGTWAGAARGFFDEARETGDIPSDLSRAVEGAMLCESAALQWGFEQERALSPLEQIEAAREEILDAGESRTTITRDVRGDGRWAERYLALQRRDAAERLEQLERLAASNRTMGPVNGEVLAEAALLPERAPVKSSAQRIVRERKDEFWVLKGLLDALNRAPRSYENITLIEDVSGQTLSRDLAGDWADFARRLLLERLLVMLASERPASAADVASERLRDVYRRRADALRDRSALPSSAEADAARGPQDAIDAAELLRRRWRTEAGRYAGLQQGWRSPTDLDRRHEGRLELAEGVVQRFAATQVGVAEAMASVVAAERPSRRPLIEDMMSRLATERRRAAGVAGQILAAERVMVGLWMIRLGVELPESEPEA